MYSLLFLAMVMVKFDIVATTRGLFMSRPYKVDGTPFIAPTLSHGMTYTPLYGIWVGMKNRCNNPKYADYHRYGGRGIKVCEPWEYSFVLFYADMGEPPKGAHLHRKDNNKGYDKDNCVWLLPKSHGEAHATLRILEQVVAILKEEGGEKDAESIYTKPGSP